MNETPENKPEEKQCPAPWVAKRRAYIGFTIFDIVHIVGAIVALILALTSEPANTLQIAESGIAILLSILLIGFIAALAKHDHNRASFHGFYTFAWLCAVTNIIIPAIFSLSELVAFGWNVATITALNFGLVSVALTLIIFSLFFLSLFNRNASKKWSTMMRIPIVLVIILSLVLFVSEFFVAETSLAERILNCVEDLVPLVPAVLGITLFRDKDFCE